jgi:hypothetical protein
MGRRQSVDDILAAVAHGGVRPCPLSSRVWPTRAAASHSRLREAATLDSLDDHVLCRRTSRAITALFPLDA